MDALTRRQFVRTAAAGALGALAPAGAFAQEHGAPFPLCFFSKHLPSMDAVRLGRTLRQLGFQGVDLTVRPGGHVAPARAGQDLVPFVERLRGEGMDVPMITTGLLSDADPAARPTLEAAARLKVPYFKPGYYRYAFTNLERELADVERQVAGLARLSAETGVQMGFHNHAGYVGASIWDVAAIIERFDAKWVGYYFDPRHAVVEGGDAGWRLALLKAAPRLKMIALKDFYWEKTAKGWQQRHCPMGEGMVDWKAFFTMLRQAGFRGPASLHLEYEIPGKTPADIERHTIEATEKDLAFIKARVAEAWL